MRKHVFDPYTDKCPLAVCVHCGKTSGLNDWQLADMPAKEMASCPSHNAPRPTFAEWLFDFLAAGTSFNCLKSNTGANP